MKSGQAAAFPEADVVRDIGYVSTQDGTRIAYISYRPKSGRYPTVFMYDPYNASATPFQQAKEFLDAGYAFVGANMTATGCSEGIIDHWYTRKEGVHGAEVVEWIARQPWSDGNVGMVGNSSAGSSQLWVAAERPPHLRAIVPTGVEDDFVNHEYLGGVAQPALVEWAFRTQFLIPLSGMEWRINEGDAQCDQICESGRQIIKRPFFDEMLKHPVKDEWWDLVSPVRPDVAGEINVPTLIVAMFQDFGATAESLKIFTQQMAEVKNKKLVMINGDHGSAGLGPRGYSIIDAERMKFLDRWVKGVKNGIENEPPVTVYWEVQVPDGDAKKSVAGWVTHHERWPDPAVERRPLYLTADAKLSPDHTGPSPDDDGARLYLYPTGVELVSDNQQFAVEPCSTGVLNYRSAQATSDMTLLGNPEVRLYLGIDRGDDADLALTLKDIGPDGNVLFLQSGLRRASFREIDEVQSHADEVVPTFRKSEKLEPGKIYEIRMSLIGPIAHVVRSGHSLELTIGAPSANRGLPAGAISINRVYHSEKYPSKILLPILPNAVAKAPAPECGMLRGQPCRKETSFCPGGLLPLQ
ncbi:MAG: CocE/NonD family hydrolase [Mesorhizobium sp.]|uniref:CocE/NonD family hydrolase n=1 Tax=unclassified Mesorhizobium TaxID=325217 RepID=UPI000FD89DA3|nr:MULTISPECIES: CocE/NonD family hydrolase [unclassified Mesorhizobium]AZV19417.1 CocE/NonD family hydrolase [Mesorhizobium sp. M7A.F.Ce.TU.012.03.2.1]MDF3156470.1 CocE/NonD family hydrolase [Mesorhizobium sp. XAP10]MDF3249345.1 CocE/NonD family hydrolase [Mesorhizobium sp. XAP4]RWN25174.1 MAG: CocE/NonD family hydrolase [Mesorhizobium sp.]RWN40544.1 MAG: CocE/NonD family hydrolase [Mesorhizobium sp.]